jgi:hypothetical protein
VRLAVRPSVEPRQHDGFTFLRTTALRAR